MNFNVEKYLEAQASFKKKKKPQSKIVKKEGEEGSAEYDKPVSIKYRDAGFEMKIKGHPDARITGTRPPKPEDTD